MLSKSVGAAMLLLSGYLLGQGYVTELGERIRALERLTALLSELCSRVENYALPLSDFLDEQGVEEKTDVLSRWESFSCSLRLGRITEEALRELGAALARGVPAERCFPHALQSIERTQQTLQTRYEESRRLCPSLGLGAAVLLTTLLL